VVDGGAAGNIEWGGWHGGGASNQGPLLVKRLCKPQGADWRTDLESHPKSGDFVSNLPTAAHSHISGYR
jgi:hypothetical protein